MDFIGVIDSGVGGLTVLQSLRRSYPYNFLYVADHAFCPYGTKINEVIFARASALVRFLKAQGAQAVVLACNTISVYADRLQQEYELPVYDVITPTCKRIAESNAHSVALLATRSTIANGLYQTVLSKYGIRTYAFDCSAFVPYVEQRSTTSIACQHVIFDALRNLPDVQADAVILGCTHFPLLKRQISYYCAESKIVECYCNLPHGLTSSPSLFGNVSYFTTGNADFANNAASWYDGGKANFRHIDLF